MTTSGGLVLVNAAQDRAVFLTGAELASIQDAICSILDRPTAAGGTLETTGLERLSRAVELADQSEPYVVLSGLEEDGLDLVRAQGAVRASLPLRTRRTCKDCGNERLVNPSARPAAPAERSGFRSYAGDVLDSLEKAAEGHPIIAALSLAVNLINHQDSPQTAQEPQCGLCEGVHFAVANVTFCPKCRAVREESVLYLCPECGFDFASRSVVSEFWVTFEKAMADAILAHNAALVRANAPAFENGLRASQQDAMLHALRSDEKLIAMCRCGLPGQVGRYVALLLTTHQLIWNRQSAVSDVTGSNVPWTDVLAIRPHNAEKNTYERGIQIELRDGPPLLLTDFRGKGVAFEGSQVTFTVEGLFNTMNDLWQRRDEAIATPVVPAPAALPSGRHARSEPPEPMPVPVQRAVGRVSVPPPPSVPAAPPRPRTMKPGWYPDPSRAARLRWWTGTQWTSFSVP